MDSSPGFSDYFYSAPDGLKLHARIYGENVRERWPVVCLPGLTRNARDFHELAMLLSHDRKRPRKVVAFDYRGRGQSAYDPDWKNYDIVVEAGDIVAGLTALGIEHAAFIGTSRGGLIIHVLAAMRPGAFKGGGAERHRAGGRGRRAGAYPRLSRETRTKPKSFAEAQSQSSERRTARPFRRLTDADWERFVACALPRRERRAGARFRPGIAESRATADFDKPLPALWPQFEGLSAIPMLAIRGENSKLLSAATLEEMARRHPDCQTVTVEGQGHAPLLETGDLPATIAGFHRPCRKAVQPLAFRLRNLLMT